MVVVPFRDRQPGLWSMIGACEECIGDWIIFSFDALKFLTTRKNHHHAAGALDQRWVYFFIVKMQSQYAILRSEYKKVAKVLQRCLLSWTLPGVTRAAHEALSRLI